MISQEDYATLILPWQAFYDETWKRNYFYNSETGESVWVLPQEVSDRVQGYYEDKLGDDFEDNNNVVKYISASDRMTKDNSAVLSRPARKQVETSLAKNFAYQQGDEEYNIWYDKYQSEKREKEREPAPTRCEPELDAGYTKADKMEKFSSYFCFHFARGCCAEGANCTYYHRIPTLDECSQIDQAKDIFGRPRYATHREDMDGIGTFLKDTRTLEVSDFKMPSGNDPIASMYEIFWRHFSTWGDIEDINLHPGKGVAFIKYAHRCMAEYAKFAMQNQALDADEILVIKWAADEGEEEKKEGEKEKKEKKNDKNKKKRREPRDKSDKPVIEETFEAGYGQTGELNLDSAEEQILKHRKKEIQSSVNLMGEVLKNIERRNKGEGDDEDAFDEDGNLRNENQDGNQQGLKNSHYHSQYGYVNPANNNMPLF